MEAPSHVDIAVVGSGYGGAVMARRFAEAGAKTAIFERGAVYDSKNVSRSLTPFTETELYRVIWSIDGRTKFRIPSIIGGGSVVSHGVCLRSPAEVFSYQKNGRRSWPEGIDRAAMDPFYEIAERELGARQISAKDVASSGYVMGEMLFAAGHSADRCRTVISGCTGCGLCEAGCASRRKKDLSANYLSKATIAGAKLFDRAEVKFIRKVGGVYAITIRDGSGNSYEVAADKVILAAGAVGAPALLAASAGYLPISEEQFNREISVNGELIFAAALPKKHEGLVCWKGGSHAGLVSYSFFNSNKFVLHAASTHPSFFGRYEISLPGKRAFGLENKQFIRSALPGSFVSGYITGISETRARLQYKKNKISVEWAFQDMGYHNRVWDSLQAAFAKSGATLCWTKPGGLAQGGRTLLGSVRMADSKEHGGCDRWGGIWGMENIIVADGAAIPADTAVPSSLTVAANAERIASHWVKAG